LRDHHGQSHSQRNHHPLVNPPRRVHTNLITNGSPNPLDTARSLQLALGRVRHPPRCGVAEDAQFKLEYSLTVKPAWAKKARHPDHPGCRAFSHLRRHQQFSNSGL
ncbi:MAG: hypothetical protein ACRDRK_11810, partial [Pseudonocardia sp.]